MHDIAAVEWVRTGIPTFDLLIGAGLPRGRFIEVIGPEATTKSVFGFLVLAAFQRVGGVAILADAEHKTDREFAEKRGVDFSKLGYYDPENLDDVIRLLARVGDAAKPKVPTCFVWDSIAGTPGIEELEEAGSEEGFSERPGKRAAYLSIAMRTTLGRLKKKGVTLVGINQLRTQLNFGGRSGVGSPGGRAVRHHASVRLHFRPEGKIKDRELDVYTGIQVQVEAVKNTVAPPYRRATLKFKFDTGFVPYSGLDELLIRHRRITTAGGWLHFRGRKFRAADFEKVAAEMPDILAPIRGSYENPEQPVEDDEGAGPGEGES